MSELDISALIDRIDSESKEQFLQVLHELIEHDIARRSTIECLGVVTISPKGYRKEWRFDGNYLDRRPRYVLRFISFIRNEPYTEDGVTYKLDSALTESILSIVSTGVTELVEEYKDDITQAIFCNIMLNDHLRDVLFEGLIKHKLPNLAVARMRSILIAKTFPDLDTIQNISTHIVGGATAIIVKLSATSAGKIVLHQLGLSISHNLIPIAAKLLAKPAVILIMKKLAVTAIVAALLKIITIKFGSALTAGLSVAIVPAIITWLTIDIASFPRKLGAGVADSICEQLRNGFKPTMTDIISKIMQTFTEDSVIQSLAQTIVNDPGVKKELLSLLQDS